MTGVSRISAVKGSLMTLKEVAGVLCKSVRWVTYRIEDGTFEAVRIGPRGWRIDSEVVNNYIEKMKTVPDFMRLRKKL